MRVGNNGELSDSVDTKLAETLFNQSAVMIIGGFGPGAVAVLAMVRNGHHWYLWWTIASAIVLCYRLALDMAFRRRRVQTGRLVRWRRRFLIGTWANGAICGIGAAATVLMSDLFSQMLVFSMVTAFVMGSAARNATYPKAAIGSILLTEVPVQLACLAVDDIYYRLFAVFILLFTLAALSVARYIYVQTVRLLVTDEQNAALFGEVDRSNRELAAANERLGEANARLAEIAGTDGLTGVPNRRTLDEAFETELRAARREGAALSVLMFDIDSFKKYNDRYGHQAGDACLRRVAQALATTVSRPRDLMARYGGEEFVGILPHTERAGAAALAEAVRFAVADLRLAHTDSATGYVTVSIGAATSRSGEVETASELLRRADHALYVAKRSGRNRVHSAPDESAPAEVPVAT